MLNALIASGAAGALVTLSGYLFGRRKTSAEAAAAESLASKTDAEAADLQGQTWSAVNKELRDFMAYQKNQIDELLKRVDELDRENREMRTRTDELDRENRKLRARVRTLERELHHMDDTTSDTNEGETP